MRIARNTKILIFILLLVVNIAVMPAFAINENKEIKVDNNDLNKEKVVSKISFDEVLKLSKEHAYDLKMADYEILISKQDVRLAKSEYFPKLNFMAGMEYTKNFRDVRETTVMSIGDAFINPYTRFQSVLGITVAYNLFDFGVRSGNLKIAKEEVNLKELELKQKLQEMNLTLLDAYTKVLITTKQIIENQKILEIQEKSLEIQERLFNAKVISQMDFNKAKVDITKTKAKISELKGIREESLNWLTFYTGVKFDSENLKIEEIKKDNFDVLAFTDYTKSLVWKVYDNKIKKKELEVFVAKRNYLPKMNLYSRYYLYGADQSNIGKSLGIEPSNFSVGASLNMPIFDGFRNSANVQKNVLELKQMQIERDKAIAELMAKLANMRSNLMYLDEQITQNNIAINELSAKEKALHRLASQRVISPIEENEAKIELINEKIELEKNSITNISIIRGIEILTEEY